MGKFVRLAVLICFVVIAGVTGAQAANYTPSFSDYSFPGSQFDVDAAANAFFNTNYGITIDRMYLYRDSRDTFDGIGVANGFVADIPSPVTGRINFSDTTNFVTVDYLFLVTGTFNVYSSGDVLIDTFSAGPGTGTRTLSGSPISYLTLSSDAGYTAISGMTYNYDGTTDGINTDLDRVPEPSAMLLLGSGLVGLVGYGRKRSRK